MEGREEVFDKYCICKENVAELKKNKEIEQCQVKCTESAELKPEDFEKTSSVLSF